MPTTLGSFIAGGVAACGAVTATHGFETVKIRLQLQGELQSNLEAVKVYKGVFHGVNVILKNEGLRGLYRGVGSAYIYQIFLNGCRIGFYEPIRKNVTQTIYGNANRQSLGINLFAGAASGVAGAAMGSPFQLVKIRLQSFSPFFPVGTQYPYRSSLDGLQKIYHNDGIRGLYRGVGAAMVRTGFGGSVQLPTYFFAKRQFTKRAGMEDGVSLHLMSSVIAGVAVCVVMHPLDTIMSRMYNQKGDLYKSAFDCLLRTIKTEGIPAIYKGFTAHLTRLLPHTILTLSLAEQTNKLISNFEQNKAAKLLDDRL